MYEGVYAQVDLAVYEPLITADIETAPGQSAVYEPLITPLEAGNPNQAAAVDADRRRKKKAVVITTEDIFKCGEGFQEDGEYVLCSFVYHAVLCIKVWLGS